MSHLAELAERELHAASDHIDLLDGVTWEDYERFHQIRGDRSAPRMTYLHGVLEISVFVRQDEHYVPADRSAFLPGIDLGELTSFLEYPTTSQAIRAYRDRVTARAAG